MLSKLFVLRTYNQHTRGKIILHATNSHSNNRQSYSNSNGGLYGTALRSFSTGENAEDGGDAPTEEPKEGVEGEVEEGQEGQDGEKRRPRMSREEYELHRFEKGAQLFKDVVYMRDSVENEELAMHFPDTRYTPERFVQHQNFKRKDKAETLEKLKMYEQSDELIAKIKEKLANTATDKNGQLLASRLQSKLSASGNVYEKHLADKLAGIDRRVGKAPYDL